VGEGDDVGEGGARRLAAGAATGGGFLGTPVPAPTAGPRAPSPEGTDAGAPVVADAGADAEAEPAAEAEAETEADAELAAGAEGSEGTARAEVSALA
jgi:hypothetical protein